MILGNILSSFLFPSLNRRFLARILLLSLLSWGLFSYVFLPLNIDGRSMEPTYHDGSWNFCNRLSYLFSGPRRFDVVAIRMAGNKVVLLKRVVALSGETVMFRDGQLFVNGRELDEPYLTGTCDWNLPRRRVADGKVYVVGDNRRVPMQMHVFGQVGTKRILGRVLW